jgi:hypothetical protein
MLFKPTVIANSKISNAFKITGYARVQANYSDYSWNSAANAWGVYAALHHHIRAEETGF